MSKEKEHCPLSQYPPIPRSKPINIPNAHNRYVQLVDNGYDGDAEDNAKRIRRERIRRLIENHNKANTGTENERKR